MKKIQYMIGLYDLDLFSVMSTYDEKRTKLSEKTTNLLFLSTYLPYVLFQKEEKKQKEMLDALRTFGIEGKLPDYCYILFTSEKEDKNKEILISYEWNEKKHTIDHQYHGFFFFKKKLRTYQEKVPFMILAYLLKQADDVAERKIIQATINQVLKLMDENKNEKQIQLVMKQFVQYVASRKGW